MRDPDIIPCKLFVRTRAPWPDPVCPERIRWLTWSATTRRALHELNEEIPRLAPPTLEYFEQAEYGYTLTWDGTGLQPALQRRLAAIAQALYRIEESSDLILLDHLLDDAIAGTTIRTLFAFIRAYLVARTGDPLVAIYAPLGAVGGTEQADFPLHADLYPPVFLFNIFDRVPADESGTALFLPMAALRRVVGRLPSVPAKAKEEFRELVTRPSQTDRYDQFYEWLHGENPWKQELQEAMEAVTVRVRLGRGQGYLLHDRRWLHGRDAPSGGVPNDRLHRLIFDTETTCKARQGAGRGVSGGTA